MINIQYRCLLVIKQIDLKDTIIIHFYDTKYSLVILEKDISMMVTKWIFDWLEQIQSFNILMYCQSDCHLVVNCTKFCTLCVLF